MARSVQSRALKPSPNNSLDLSICEWDGAGTHVKLFVDTAPKAQLRYYNLLAEQHEYYNADPELKARQIKGVGEDSAYGGAGAWWTRGRNQLVVYDHNKILKVRVERRRLERCACARRRHRARKARGPEAARLARLSGRPDHDLVHADVRRARRRRGRSRARCPRP